MSRTIKPTGNQQTVIVTAQKPRKRPRAAPPKGQSARIVTREEGHHLTHRTLWSVVDRQIENASARKSGSAYDDMAAMVFAFHAFEAYLNFLGSLLDPQTWANEREFFNQDPYRGFAGKVRWVFEKCEMQEPDRSRRPYQTIWSLKALRDAITHGKVVRISKAYSHPISARPPMVGWVFADRVSHKKALQAREDVLNVTQYLHTAASRKVGDPMFGSEPFGVFSYATYSLPPKS